MSLRYSVSVVLLVSVTMLFASQSVVVDREYDPVIVHGSELALYLNAPVGEIYVYHLVDGVWTQIPFQIDEKDGTDYFGEKNGLLDPDDEICFMVKDMGDSAAANNWIDNAESFASPRYQIAAVDTSLTPQPRTYAYIYRSSTLDVGPGVVPYMSYVPPNAEVADDTIKGSSYVFGHNNGSIPDFLAIKSEVGGTNKDILDRWKIHYKGSILGTSYDENEDTGLAFRALDLAGGPVRIFRQAWFDVVMGGDTPIGDPVAFLSTFYPFSAQINTSDKTLDPSYGVELLRQTIDFDPIIAGSQFYSDLNSDILVDGDPTVDDNVDPTLAVPGINWYMVQGSHGTVATVVDVPLIGDHQELYYKDNSTINPEDTGDQMAYGECGIQVYDLENPIAGTFSLATTMYYLGPNHTPAIGDTLADQFANPLDIQVVSNAFVIPVELASFSAQQIKGEIVLHWTTATESKNFGFEIQKRQRTKNDWEKIGFVIGAGTSSSVRTYQFIDRNIQKGKVQYRLKQIDSDGQSTFSEIAVVSVEMPTQMVLAQNYPNPFNPSTEISFQIPADLKGSASLKIFNLLGQEVRTLVNSPIDAGYHTVQWDGRDNSGRDVISGTYIYRLQVGDKTSYRKMVKLQ